MYSKKYFLSACILCAAVMSFSFSSPAQDKPAAAGHDHEKGWGTVSGVLEMMEIDFLPETIGKELVLRRENNEIVMLIGEVAGRLLDGVGEQVTVTGVYKPKKEIKGVPVAVMEVRFIDARE